MPLYGGGPKHELPHALIDLSLKPGTLRMPDPLALATQ
jgi:hypothetical protein